MKWSLLLVLGCMLLALGCQSEKDNAPPYASTFVRQPNPGETIMGTIGGKGAEMTFSIAGDDIEGQVYFTSTKTFRSIKGKISYEGLLRLEAIPMDDTPSPVPSTAKGIFLTSSNLVGVWQGPYADEPEFMDLGHYHDDDYYNFEDGMVGKEQVRVSHWLRQVDCVAQSGDTTGTLLFEVPQLAVARGQFNWPMVYWSLVKSLIYQPNCTCKGLAKQGGGNMRLWIDNVSIIGDGLRVVQYVSLDGKELEKKTLSIDLLTGQLQE